MKRLLALAVAAALALAACGGGVDTTTSLDTDTSTTSPTDSTEPTNGDMSGTIEEIQTEINELQTQIQNSAAAQDLQDAWMTLTAEVTAAMAAINDDGMIEGAEVQAAIENFETTLDELGEQVEPELRAAWDAFRQRVESLMS